MVKIGVGGLSLGKYWRGVGGHRFLNWFPFRLLTPGVEMPGRGRELSPVKSPTSCHHGIKYISVLIYVTLWDYEAGASLKHNTVMT